MILQGEILQELKDIVLTQYYQIYRLHVDFTADINIMFLNV